MEEIKKFLRLMTKEELVSLAASMLFTQLVNVVDLAKDLAKLKEVKNGWPGV